MLFPRFKVVPALFNVLFALNKSSHLTQRAPEENSMRVKLNLRNQSVPVKVAKGRQIVNAMTNNTSFATPHPALTDVTAALDELENAFAQVQSAES
jgi:hypothetical protein